MTSVATTYRITHQPGVTFMTANGVLVGLLVGAGAVTLAYAMDQRLLGAFETADAAIAAVVAAQGDDVRASTAYFC
jgi:hypothetical protein